MSNMMVRRGVLFRKWIPTKEYRACEYIEQIGEAYIDTGVKVTSTVQFDCVVGIPTFVRNHWLLGGRNNTSTQNGVMHYTGSRIQFRYGNANESSTSKTSGFYHLTNRPDAEILLVDNESVSCSEQSFTTSRNFLLLGFRNGTSTGFSYIGTKMKECKIYENGNLVRDFIPCQRKSDNKYGMYDLIGRQFYLSPNGVEFGGGNNS